MTLIYDCEIARCIPQSGEPLNPDLDYCEGWEDFAGMGVSCVCAWVSPPGLYRVWIPWRRPEAGWGSEFCPEILNEFASLASASAADEVVGFNSIAFDDRLLAAHGITVRTTYDLLGEVRIASGQPREYVAGVTRAGYGLDALARANGLPPKSGRGDLAPVLWQTGRVGELVDYCLRDVQATRQLYEWRYSLLDPTTGRDLCCAPLGDISDLEASIEEGQRLEMAP